MPDVATALSGVIKELNNLGITPTIVSGFRTADDQVRMQNGGSGNRPAAKISLHQTGNAVDIDIDLASPQTGTVVNVMSSFGFGWGASFRDPPHFYMNPFGTPGTFGYYTNLFSDASVKLSFYKYCHGSGK